MLPLLSPLFATPAHADHPLGTVIEDSVVVDVSGDGFGLLESTVAALVPTRIDIPPFAAGDEAGCVPFIGCASEYRIDLSNAYVELEIGTFELLPGTNTLSLDVDLTVYINRSTDPADLYIFGEILGIDLFDDTCDLYLDPVRISLDAAIQLELRHDPNGRDLDGDGQPDTKKLDVVVPPVTWSWDADENDFNFDNCGAADVINTINDITDFFGFNIYEEILGLVEPEIDAIVQDLPASIEPALEDLFAELVINEQLDLLGTTLDVTLWPSTVSTAPAGPGNSGGMRLGLSSLLEVPTADCVAAFAQDASLATPSQPPAIGTAPGVPFSPSATAWIDDDFVNHVLFAAWKGGLLCFEISADSEDISLPEGIPLDTSLLPILAPGVYDGLFPTLPPAPLEIRTDPRQPPITVPDGPHDFDIEARELGVGFVAELDGRKTRFLELSLDADIGADLTWDNSIGAIGATVALDASSFTPVVTANEFRPDSGAVIEGQFAALFDLLIQPILTDALAGLSFPVPTFEGIGITDLDAGTAGTNGDWTGLYLAAGTPTYYSAGCDTSKGCDTSSCSKGCSVSSGGGNVVFVLAPLLVAFLRRRA
jgi:hypothetical protein